jgi:Kef-type K+ transport system membrane component KefB
MLFAIQWPHGPVLEFLVLFAVILLGPTVVSRFGVPGLVGLLLGGFAVGPHGLGLIHAGNQTVPELGHLGLLYLMFVAGLELDLQVLRRYRTAAVALGLLAFAIPFLLGLAVGFALGWGLAASFLLGALLSSHTLITYPALRDAGLGGNPAVASAVGATVLTDTLALVVLALVAGSQTEGGSPAAIVAEITLGFTVLLVVGLVVLPRVVDLTFRTLATDRVSRYLVIVVALLFMAMLADVFGIEGIVGAFFAGLALNQLVPNEGPSMERVEFFGSAVFIPVFLVSIGLLLDPSVMFKASTLGLAALICAAALGGKFVACWLAGSLLRFNRPERAAMFVLTAPQAAATLAVTLIGFEIGLFGTSVVNAVLVLILVSIVLSAVLADRVVRWMPERAAEAPRLGERVLVVTTAQGPSEVAVRTAGLLIRPDGGHSDLLITRTASEPPLGTLALRGIEKRVFRDGFDGEVETDVDVLPAAVAKAVLRDEPSLVIVDDPGFSGPAARVPLLVVRSAEQLALIVQGGAGDGVAAEIERRLARDGRTRLLRRPSRLSTRTPPRVVVLSAS